MYGGAAIAFGLIAFFVIKTMFPAGVSDPVPPEETPIIAEATGTLLDEEILPEEAIATGDLEDPALVSTDS